jgi:NAD(P)-dependent dehydrogenase (short-subunit alcohol dehydrogenase family)
MSRGFEIAGTSVWRVSRGGVEARRRDEQRTGCANADNRSVWRAWDGYSDCRSAAGRASRAAVPYLRQSKQGHIINIGANAALKASAGMGAYAASKAGVHRLTESLAEELKGDGITVNAVLPSIIDTPANRADMPNADFSKWVTPQALADVILFLASPQAQAIIGALLPVTGRV